MKKILTIIFDGFGIREEEKGNAVKLAKMENFNRILSEYPHALLSASEEAVGLNSGQAGNSEVGHMTIGAGRLLKQNEILVNEFLENPDYESTEMKKLASLNDKTIHLIGLCSDGNIHAGVDDFINTYNMLINIGYKDIVFHLITDGRDTGINSSYKYIKMIKDVINETGIGTIATICGRYYGMDRDKNWGRTKVYYDLITKGVGIKSIDIERTINKYYDNSITDEFIKPIVTNNKFIKNGDVIFWMNYRADRSKQILDALINYSKFDAFDVLEFPDNTYFSFLPVDRGIKTINLIKPIEVKNSLGMYLSELDFTQARIAESEKFPHVTYFFDGGYNGTISKCSKIEVPSPEVKTYDLKPEMSAVEVTKKIVKCMENDYDFILANFANPDMVGHTGNLDATVHACMAIDLCLGKILERAEDNFYNVIILADHGNAEEMINKDGTMCTTHTINKVPFVICDSKIKLKQNGSLVNVAPTILDYMDIAIPMEMEGTESLIIEE